MNKVQLSGRMGRDPEVRSTSSGGTITSASLATSNDYKNKSGQWVRKPPSWHNLVAFGPVGEALALFHKGDILRVEGKITYDEWTDKDGKKRTTTKIVCFEVAKESPRGSEAPF